MKNEKAIRDAFVELFIEMFNNNTDNVELTFDFGKCIAKFNVTLEELKEVKRE